MSWPKVVLLLAVLSTGVALLAGFFSRAPAELRRPPGSESAADPSLGASFTEEQVARGAAFRRPGYLAALLGLALRVVTLVILAKSVWSPLVSSLEASIGSWALRTLVAGAVIGFVLVAVSIPLGYVRGYAVQHAWELSTQDFGGWVSDQLKGAAIAAVTSAIAALVFFAVVRWQPRSWWVWGWAGFTALTAAVFFLWPIVVAPLFNRFTPLDDAGLTARIRTLGADAGVPVDRVLVADASRRSTLENAYVAGLGETKRVVVYDTLLENGDEDQTAFVIAHELGHQKERHVLKGLGISSAGFLAAFGLLAWLAGRGPVWEWGGAGGVGDLRSLPVLVLLATTLTLVAMPIEAALSRRFEREADDIAIELTGDPGAAVSAFRRLALNNIADLDPMPLAVAFTYSHPPIPDRIEAILATTQDRP